MTPRCGGILHWQKRIITRSETEMQNVTDVSPRYQSRSEKKQALTESRQYGGIMNQNLSGNHHQFPLHLLPTHGWLNTKTTVTHLSTNPAWCRVTSLHTTPLPQSQTNKQERKWRTVTLLPTITCRMRSVAYWQPGTKIDSDEIWNVSGRTAADWISNYVASCREVNSSIQCISTCCRTAYCTPSQLLLCRVSLWLPHNYLAFISAVV